MPFITMTNGIILPKVCSLSYRIYKCSKPDKSFSPVVKETVLDLLRIFTKFQGNRHTSNGWRQLKVCQNILPPLSIGISLKKNVLMSQAQNFLLKSIQLLF